LVIVLENANDVITAKSTFRNKDGGVLNYSWVYGNESGETAFDKSAFAKLPKVQSTSKLRVGIIGASGYTGGELARILACHPNAEITVATASGERAGQKLSQLFSSLCGVCDVVCEEYSFERIKAECDLVFVALGHGKALEFAPPLIEAGIKVCDLGADFRLRNPAQYKQWYKLDHTAPALLESAVYGLPELHREKIKSAQLVANPGCYVTSAVLALAPFIATDTIKPHSIIVDAASGVSGAGRSSFSLDNHFTELHDNFKAYGVAGHRHTPEIEQGLTDATVDPNDPDRQARVCFTPHLLPIARGILSTCYAAPWGELASNHTAEKAHEILSAHYENEPFVRVLSPGQFPQVKQVAGSNFCDIGVTVDQRTERVIVISALDNLVKGASGQAVQNMNLMCGFDETAGLLNAPLFP
jgi:N-acetyl-gamma-glutamyl-phosphate reductase